MNRPLERKKQSSAAMVEMALLLALIAMVGFVWVEKVGDRVGATFCTTVDSEHGDTYYWNFNGSKCEMWNPDFP